MSDDKRQPRKRIRIPTPKELDESTGDEQSQQDGPQEQKDVRSRARRFRMRVRGGVGRNKKVLKAPRPYAEQVVREIPPDRQPVPVDDDTRRPVNREEIARELARQNAQKNGHDIGKFEPTYSDGDKKFIAICKKCRLGIEAVLEFDTYDVKGLPVVGGKAKNTRCKGEVQKPRGPGYSSGTS